METDIAVDIFMRRFSERTYKSTVRDIKEFLENGPVERKPKVRDLELHQWFQSLDEAQKSNIEEIVQKTAFSGLFGALVVLDNLTGGYPVKGQLSDFALYLQTYENTAARSVDRNQDKIRINQSKSDITLHDLIGNYIE